MARKRPRLSHEGNRSRNDESEHPEPPLLLVFGVYAYEAKRFDEISFQVGDRMKVLQNVEDYYEVLHFKTMRQGLVPKMLVEEERRFEDEEWFFKDIAREKATSLLLYDTGTTGTFLIRKSKQPSFLLYVLHIKYREHEDYKVAHFEIKVSKSGRYYIEFNNSFPSMPALVWNYKNNPLDTLGIN
ncbi:tyrosine-protein kinase Src64B-like [Ctenocephalides felis]|uniref:tyrosine-protein kinase Src64B-like n=1 Tax=Ctenocephalides felis TaxID=7515 RepID=UPI000E6E5457|nr:tyrosine-protein kinase Src64B-like [Ctenocephalides felis]